MNLEKMFKYYNLIMIYNLMGGLVFKYVDDGSSYNNKIILGDCKYLVKYFFMFEEFLFEYFLILYVIKIVYYF